MKLTGILFISSILYFIAQTEKPALRKSGSFKDPRDNHIYKTIQIGKQTWMAENLAYLPIVNKADEHSHLEGDQKASYYVYGYNGNNVDKAKKTSNYLTFGVLYSFIAARSSAPAGWHLPTEAEWQELERYCGMAEKDLGGTQYRNSGQVGLKLRGKSGWKTSGLNEFGFTALPGGFRAAANPAAGTKGYFAYLNEEAFFWTATAYKERNIAYWRSIGEERQGVFKSAQSFSKGYSIRCIKDE